MLRSVKLGPGELGSGVEVGGWGRGVGVSKVGVRGDEIGGVEVGGLGSGVGVRGLGSAELWLGDGVRRVGVEEVGVGGLGSGVLRSVKLGPGELGSGG